MQTEPSLTPVTKVVGPQIMRWLKSSRALEFELQALEKLCWGERGSGNSEPKLATGSRGDRIGMKVQLS